MPVTLTTSEVAHLLNTTVFTIRRWSDPDHFARFLSVTATPTTGDTRAYTELDLRVLTYVKTLRDNKASLSTIKERLEAAQQEDYINLPPAPTFNLADGLAESIPVPLAEARSRDIAEIAVLRREVQRLNEDLTTARKDADQVRESLRAMLKEKDQDRITIAHLDRELIKVQGQVAVLEEKLRTAEERARAAVAEEREKVATAEGHLNSYRIGGREVHPLILAGAVLIASVILIVILLVLAKLLV